MYDIVHTVFHGLFSYLLPHKSRIVEKQIDDKTNEREKKEGVR